MNVSIMYGRERSHYNTRFINSIEIGDFDRTERCLEQSPECLRVKRSLYLDLTLMFRPNSEPVIPIEISIVQYREPWASLSLKLDGWGLFPFWILIPGSDDYIAVVIDGDVDQLSVGFNQYTQLKLNWDTTIILQACNRIGHKYFQIREWKCSPSREFCQ